MTWNAQPLSVAVLEDDEALREDILVPYLGEAGFESKGFASAADLRSHLRETSFDLLVLDLVLPDAYGLDVARELRAASPIGIVTLTGRGTHPDQIRGLNDAVDAWLAKPVDLDLLAATLCSLARRMHLSEAGPAEAADGVWRLAQRGWQLCAPDNRRVALNLLERHLLGRLLSTPGEVVSRVEIMALFASTARNFDSHRLEMLVHRLRRKVRDRLGQTLPLRAVRGQGYVMVVVAEPDHD
jgi:DNA-binding response OmpR family regulator